MTIGLAVLVLVACVMWLVRRGRWPGSGPPQYTGALPNSVRVPINQEELTRAEEELAEDPDPRLLEPGVPNDDEEDWGPGAPR